MTTGAQEVTTVDELQLCFVGGTRAIEPPLYLQLVKYIPNVTPPRAITYTD